ncbi:MAG: EF-hand domain-containing protein, partial [Cyanobacteria bacterium K_DeepCast_35m_m2_023]|nr:EF-hand domain-containing protein [Cyanobacteria bacterium K_DeepCast_35m_m2_023]
MQQLQEREQLITLWTAVQNQAGSTDQQALAQRLAAVLQDADLAIAEAEITPLLHALAIPAEPSPGLGRLLLTVLAGSQTLRCEEAYGVLARACPDGVSVAVLKRLLTIFDLTDSEAEAIAIAMDRDGGGLITRDDFQAFLPEHFSRHPRSYHATHLAHRTSNPEADSPREAAPAPAAMPPATATEVGGTSPLQMQIGLFRLLQGAAYRSFRASYSANSETHLRAYDLPYTIDNFGRFVDAAVD